MRITKREIKELKHEIYLNYISPDKDGWPSKYKIRHILWEYEFMIINEKEYCDAIFEELERLALDDPLGLETVQEMRAKIKW